MAAYLSFLLHLPFSKQCVNTSLYFAAFSLLCVCESRPLLVNRNPLAMRVLPTETKGCMRRGAFCERRTLYRNPSPLSFARPGDNRPGPQSLHPWVPPRVWPAARFSIQAILFAVPRTRRKIIIIMRLQIVPQLEKSPMNEHWANMWQPREIAPGELQVRRSRTVHCTTRSGVSPLKTLKMRLLIGYLRW